MLLKYTTETKRCSVVGSFVNSSFILHRYHGDDSLKPNVFNLEHIGGFKRVWAESLQGHLPLSIDDIEN